MLKKQMSIEEAHCTIKSGEHPLGAEAHRCDKYRMAVSGIQDVIQPLIFLHLESFNYSSSLNIPGSSSPCFPSTSHELSRLVESGSRLSCHSRSWRGGYIMVSMSCEGYGSRA